MESIEVTENPALFDKLLNNGLPEGGDMKIVIKPDATTEGNPVAVVSWTVQLPDGTVGPVQAATTTRVLAGALSLVSAFHQKHTGENLSGGPGQELLAPGGIADHPGAEPFVHFRGGDPYLPEILRNYADLLEQDGMTDEAARMDEMIGRVIHWQKCNPEKMTDRSKGGA